MAETIVYHGSNPEVGAVETVPATIVMGTIVYHGFKPDVGAVESNVVSNQNVEQFGVIPI